MNKFALNIDNRALKNSAFVALIFAAASFSLPAYSAQYYVDQGNSAASDSNNGSSSLPWRTLYALNNRAFSPGDQIIVRNGVYSMTSGGSWDAPAVNIGSSGTQSSPITIKAENIHGAILDGGGSAANAPLGSKGRNWVVIDGFEIRNVGPKGIAIFDATGVVVQNCVIHGVNWNSTPGDNTDGIRVERSSQISIRNNDIYGVNSGQTNHWNGTAIKLYDTSNVTVEHNYIHDYAGSGIFDKRGGMNNTYRYNMIKNVYDGFVVNTVSGYTNGNIKFHNNIVANVANLYQVDERVDGLVSMYSNTFSEYSTMGIRVRSSNSAHRAASYNNIFARSSSLSGSFGDVVITDPAMLSHSDFNVYPASGAIFISFQYLSNQLRLSSLASWLTFSGYDNNSISAAPSFQSPSAGDYHLAANSAAKGRARVGGVASGSVIDPGAYSTGAEVIGVSFAPRIAPAPPQMIGVQ